MAGSVSPNSNLIRETVVTIDLLSPVHTDPLNLVNRWHSINLLIRVKILVSQYSIILSSMVPTMFQISALSSSILVGGFHV
ncbi:hypothetical protein GQ457_13G020290 [Hibiscus cannabinus]